MTKTITAFGLTTAVIIAGAFLFNTSTSAEVATAEVISPSCGGPNQPSCGCSSAGECGQSSCTTKKKSCGCGN